MTSLRGAPFPQDVVERLSPAATTALVLCEHCGLEYFVPAIPGDSEFYALLTNATDYYATSRWDLAQAARATSAGDRVLDVGCGAGTFLSLVSLRGAHPVGIDTSPDAVARCRVRGLEAHNVNLPGFAAANAGRFDLVSAFHVIEHVADVPAFFAQLIRCARPGGLVLVSVPNRRRIFRETFEPLDFPPHHMSRWGVEQLAFLGRQAQVTLAGVSQEPLGLAQCRQVLREVLASGGEDGVSSGPRYWLARLAARAVFGKSGYLILDRIGALQRLGLVGLSLVGRFEVPMDE